MRSALIAGLVVLVAVFGSATSASAHNHLTGGDPEDGSSVERGPQRVRLTFLASLDADGAELTVTGPDGASAVTGDPRFDGRDVTIPVRATLAGAYEVEYRVRSRDGHWAEGSSTFTVTVGESPAPSPDRSPSRSPAASSPAAEALTPAAGTDRGDGGGPSPPWWSWLVIVAGLGCLIVVAWRWSARWRSARQAAAGGT
jgi:methionine-rich copper-binding protein CopC